MAKTVFIDTRWIKDYDPETSDIIDVIMADNHNVYMIYCNKTYKVRVGEGISRFVIVNEDNVKYNSVQLYNSDTLTSMKLDTPYIKNIILNSLPNINNVQWCDAIEDYIRENLVIINCPKLSKTLFLSSRYTMGVDIRYSYNRVVRHDMLDRLVIVNWQGMGDYSDDRRIDNYYNSVLNVSSVKFGQFPDVCIGQPYPYYLTPLSSDFTETSCGHTENGRLVYYKDNMPLTFYNDYDSDTMYLNVVRLEKAGEPSDISLEYCIDPGDPGNSGNWQTLVIGRDMVFRRELSIRATSTGNEYFSRSETDYYYFVTPMNGTSYNLQGVAIYGNIMSLLDQTCLKNDVPEWCFAYLFQEMNIHKEVSIKLPSNIVGDNAYYGMFSITTTGMPKPDGSCVPVDPVYNITLPCLAPGQYAYKKMFYGANIGSMNLDIRAIDIPLGLCESMFEGSNISIAPVLWHKPSSAMCNRMFYDCENLQNVPYVSNAVVSENMFYNTLSLREITFELDKNTVQSMAAHMGLCKPDGHSVLCHCIDGDVVIDEESSDVVHSKNYLTLTALTDDSSIDIHEANNTSAYEPVDIALDYSRDGETWYTYTRGDVIDVPKGEKVMFKGNNATMCGNHFYMSGQFSASGNVMSLLDETLTQTSVSDKGLMQLFYHCQGLITAPTLPATTVGDCGYFGMFNGCTSLTKAPALPATTLEDTHCYYGMFNGCTSLEQAPELPATTLTNYCYYGMFSGCSALTQAPELPATTLAEGCYGNMFWDSGISEFTVDMTACTSVPSLPDSTLFSSSNKPYTVLVPASLYDEWKVSENWSEIAGNIEPVTV